MADMLWTSQKMQIRVSDNHMTWYWNVTIRQGYSLTTKLDSQQLLCHLFCIACSSFSKWTHNLFYLKVKRMIVWIKLKKPTVQEAASGNDTLTGNCVHKSADFLLSTIYPWKTGSFYASISSTIYPWKTGSFYANISRWVITYCFDINVKICNVLICLELIKMLPKSIHQIAPFSFQNSRIFQLLSGAHPPSDTPLCAQARNWRWRATRSSPQCSKRIFAPGRTYYMVKKIALSYGDTHIELTFLQLAIITSPK